ncbi:Bifunctional protein FolD protein [Novosphingobium resinovorum]|uniref:Bifunctional protein FolD n=2 Tax=Sphingomonadaceae TaxID=41297 RepID=A0A031K3Y4_9SPHN|nr:Bifunctional protein FolD protein [Novosphingobium resinovorum]
MAGMATDVAAFAEANDFPPALAAILVGDDPASQIYVRRKIDECGKVGIRSLENRYLADCREEELLERIDALNRDPQVHGILVQLPLPAHIDATKVLDAIDPAKDVDGFHPLNVGRISSGTGGIAPCTPTGCLLLIESETTELRGKHAVVIGKSNIVGKPIVQLLLGAGCTVTVCHSGTRDTASICRSADIVVAAVGRAGLVRGDWVKPGAIVIDVGINRVAGTDGKTRIVGDVAASEIGHAAAYTPVPGGVGPMTIACLLLNTLEAAQSLARA